MSARAWIAVGVIAAGCGSSKKIVPVDDPGPRPRPDDGTVEAVIRSPLPEVMPSPPHVALPVVPAFELPAVEPGYHSVLELHVAGTALLDTDVQVRGYVTWIYDCASAVGRPGESKKQIQKRIDADPTICERPKFYLGDTATTPPESALWIVDVPRPPNKLEKRNLPKDELDAWPPVPKIAVGDEVTVVGTFALRSPHSESNSDGLIVYTSLSHDPPGGTKVVPASPPTSTVAAAVPGAAPTAQRIAAADRDTADRLYDECTKAADDGAQYEKAAELCKQALKIWPAHHLAWWTLGTLEGLQARWADAIAAFTHAAELAPDAALYQMWLGIAEYERTSAMVRGGIMVLSADDLEPALSRLLLAVQQEPRLFRAYDYLGRIHRDRNEPREAATAFSSAIAANPYGAHPYLALTQLYDQWGYFDEAIAVGEAGIKLVVSGDELSPRFVALGHAYDDRGYRNQALAAYEAAVKADPGNSIAQFQLGQAQFRHKDYAKAKASLEAFAASAVAKTDSIASEIANTMLLEIAAAQH